MANTFAAKGFAEVTDREGLQNPDLKKREHFHLKREEKFGPFFFPELSEVIFYQR